MSKPRCQARLSAGLVLIGLALVNSGSAPAFQQDRPAPGIDPFASALLDDVANAYRSLTAYADHGTLTWTVAVDGKQTETKAEIPLAFARPNKLALNLDGVRLVCDGTTMATVRDAVSRFQKQPAPERLTWPLVSITPLGSMLVGGPTEPPVTALLALLLDDNAVGRLLDGATSLKLDGEEQVEGIDGPLKILVLERANRPLLRLAIDPKTHWIRKAVAGFDAKLLEKSTPPGVKVSSIAVEWRSGPIETAALQDERFAFKPPRGFREVVVAEAKPEAAREQHKLVGQPAPEFRLTVLDGPNKTRVLSKNDLAGKVVLLDFWATWCPPCREELPEIQQLCDQLASKHAGKVIVVAVSQDREPEEGPKVRELVEKSLNDLKVNLTKGPVAHVALDPEQRTGDVFGVEGIPMVVVLDGQGIVQAVHVGYHEGVGNSLAEQVESLLAGKSLAGKPEQAGPTGAPK